MPDTTAAHGGTLTTNGYERVFGVLEDTEAAASLQDFRERLVESVASRFHVRHVTYFRGPTLRTAFRDRTALATNDPSDGRLFDEYHEVWGRSDIFATDTALRRLSDTGAVTLGELHRLPRRSEDYVRLYLGRWDLRSCSAFTFTPGPGETALIGVFDRDERAVRPDDVRALRLLARHLPFVARSVAGPAAPASGPRPELTPRQREITELVSRGLTNAAIGRQLRLSEETVKKYVSRILAATGCASRTELAVRALGWMCC